MHDGTQASSETAQQLTELLPTIGEPCVLPQTAEELKELSEPTEFAHLLVNSSPLLLVIRCEKDGSVSKAVRKLCRDFKVRCTFARIVSMN